MYLLFPTPLKATTYWRCHTQLENTSLLVDLGILLRSSDSWLNPCPQSLLSQGWRNWGGKNWGKTQHFCHILVTPMSPTAILPWMLFLSHSSKNNNIPHPRQSIDHISSSCRQGKETKVSASWGWYLIVLSSHKSLRFPFTFYYTGASLYLNRYKVTKLSQ